MAPPWPVAGALPPCPVIGVFGCRGSGKTTRARALASSARRVLVFDPLGEWASFPGYRAISSPAALLRALKAAWRRPGFRLAYVPARAGELAAELHAVAALLWHAQAPWPACPPALLVADELNLAYPATRLPGALWGMPRVVLQGRHRGIGVVGISQRPAGVSLDFRGNCHALYLLALAAQQDRQAVLALIGRQHAAALAALEPHDYLEAIGAAVRLGRNQYRPRGR